MRGTAYLRALVRPPVDDLGGCVERATAVSLQELVLLVNIGQAKVCNLERQLQPLSSSKVPFLGGAALPTKAPELRAWPKPGLPLAPYSQVPSVSSGSSSVPAFHPPRLLQPLSPSQKARPSPTALPLQPHRRHAGSRGSCQRVVSWRAAGLSSSSFAAARGCFSPCLLHLAHRQSLSLSARHFSGSRRHSPCSRAPSC